MKLPSACATWAFVVAVCLAGCSGSESGNAAVDGSESKRESASTQRATGDHLDPVDWFLYQNTWAIGSYDRSGLGGGTRETISTAFLRAGPYTPTPAARLGDCIFKPVVGTGDPERNAQSTPNYGRIGLVSDTTKAFLNYDASTSQYVPDLSMAAPFALDAEYRVSVDGGPAGGPGEGHVRSPPHLTAANVDMPSPWLQAGDNTTSLHMPERADLKDVAFMMVIYETAPTFGRNATICAVPADKGTLTVSHELSSFYRPGVSYRGQYALARRTQLDLGADRMTVMVRSTFLYDFQME